jgi:hypothetical protein
MEPRAKTVLAIPDPTESREQTLRRLAQALADEFGPDELAEVAADIAGWKPGPVQGQAL